jgi:hypothetical protein
MSARPIFLIHPAAAEEAEKAVRWYRERSSRSAGQFVEGVNYAIDRILEAPQRWSAGPHGTRKFLLHRFPYAVVFCELPSAIQSPSRCPWPSAPRLLETPYLNSFSPDS